MLTQVVRSVEPETQIVTNGGLKLIDVTKTGACLLDVMILGDLLDSGEPSVDVPGNGTLQPPLLVLQLSLQLISLPAQCARNLTTRASSTHNAGSVQDQCHALPTCLAKLMRMTQSSIW